MESSFNPIAKYSKLFPLLNKVYSEFYRDFCTFEKFFKATCHFAKNGDFLLYLPIFICNVSHGMSNFRESVEKKIRNLNINSLMHELVHVTSDNSKIRP